MSLKNEVSNKLHTEKLKSLLSLYSTKKSFLQPLKESKRTKLSQVFLILQNFKLGYEDIGRSFIVGPPPRNYHFCWIPHSRTVDQ